MPRGPNGEQRPADTVGGAVTVAKIATGEVEDTTFEQPQKRAGGRRGGQRRAEVLTAAQRSEIAKQAATARWPS
jgi:hypothetical protein